MQLKNGFREAQEAAQVSYLAGEITPALFPFATTIFCYMCYVDHVPQL